MKTLTGGRYPVGALQEMAERIRIQDKRKEIQQVLQQVLQVARAKLEPGTVRLRVLRYKGVTSLILYYYIIWGQNAVAVLSFLCSS